MQYDILSIYQQVFGYTGVPKLVPVETDFGAEYSDRNSIFGTPLFMPTKLDDFWLPNEPMVTISVQNTIVKTVLTGVKGSVKELINTEDYAIKIQGLIINEGFDDYPEEQVRILRDIIEKRDSVAISNRMLTLFGITQVVIDSCSFIGVEGQQNCQAFEISCTSDWPLELILKDNKK